jgi:hypothetical protein
MGFGKASGAAPVARTRANARASLDALKLIEQLTRLLQAAEDELREDLEVAITIDIDLGDGETLHLSMAKAKRLYEELRALFGDQSPTRPAVGTPAHQPLMGRPLDQQQAISQRLAEFNRKGGGLRSPFGSMPGGAPSGTGPNP